jgi:pilus assembly protein CpaF
MTTTRGLSARLRQQQETPPGGLTTSTPAELAECIATVRREVLQRYPDALEAARSDRAQRPALAELIDRLVIDENLALPGLTREALVLACLNEIAGFGPLEPLLADSSVSEIMVNAPDDVWVERGGTLIPAGVAFRDAAHVLDIISRIVAPLGRRIDQTCPTVDGRLPDGSRIHAIIPPVAVRSPTLTIRRFVHRASRIEDLIDLGALPEAPVRFLGEAVHRRLSILISGGTGSGKTTTLNALAACIDASERVITIEDAAELRLPLRHVVSLEARPASIEGKGEVPIRHLVRNALRMRPDRIIIGECRGAEAFDLLQAMNTGHEGALSTVHANSPADALARLANMVLMADEGLPYEAITAQVTSAIDLVVHQARLSGGARRITDIGAVEKRQQPGGAFALRRLYPDGCDWSHEAGWQTMLDQLSTKSGRRAPEVRT